MVLPNTFTPENVLLPSVILVLDEGPSVCKHNQLEFLLSTSLFLLQIWVPSVRENEETSLCVKDRASC